MHGALCVSYSGDLGGIRRWRRWHTKQHLSCLALVHGEQLTEFTDLTGELAILNRSSALHGSHRVALSYANVLPLALFW